MSESYESNPHLVPSTATEEDIESYTEGWCHHFAVAMHRMTGWPIHVVLDEGEHYWESDTDSDNYIASVVHVLVEDPDGHFWDVRGKRHRNSLHDEMQSALHISEYGSDGSLDEDDLRMYVGCWTDDEDEDPIDRPLVEYDESDIETAQEVVRRVLADVPGLVLREQAPAL